MSALTLAELTYEQAQKALEQQERQVNELRQRTGTLLAAAALTASFFGAAALGRDGVGIPVVLAGIALAVSAQCSPLTHAGSMTALRRTETIPNACICASLLDFATPVSRTESAWYSSCAAFRSRLALS